MLNVQSKIGLRPFINPSIALRAVISCWLLSYQEMQESLNPQPKKTFRLFHGQ